MKEAKLVNFGLNELLFDVELRDNPRATNQEYSKVVTGIIGGQEVDLNYCSPRYELVPNSEIFPIVEQILLAHNIVFTAQYSHIDNARFYADIVIEDKKFAYQMNGSNGDVIKPMLRIQHSYNGLTKYRIVFGYFRLVCSNGVVIPVEEMKEYNLYVTGKHTQSIKTSLMQLNETLTYFAENADQITLAITAKYETLSGNIVSNVDDRITEVLAASKITAVDNKNFSTMDYIKNVVNSELSLYGGVTNDWLIYNAINRYIFDDRTVEAPDKRVEKDSKVFEYMLSNN